MDAAAKLVVLTNHATGSRYTLRDVRYSGIEGVGPRELSDAAGRGRALRLIADSGELRVGLDEIDARSPLNVPANLNAVEFDVEEGAGGRLPDRQGGRRARDGRRDPEGYG